MELIVNLKRPEMGRDGNMSFGEAYCVCLKIGNVSVAFDTRAFKPNKDNAFEFEYSELTFDPVELNEKEVVEGYNSAEKLLFALAADLGYNLVSKSPDSA